jgi:hypothetical protein
LGEGIVVVIVVLVAVAIACLAFKAYCRQLCATATHSIGFVILVVVSSFEHQKSL